jgi:hypothetical protein
MSDGNCVKQTTKTKQNKTKKTSVPYPPPGGAATATELPPPSRFTAATRPSVPAANVAVSLSVIPRLRSSQPLITAVTRRPAWSTPTIVRGATCARFGPPNPLMVVGNCDDGSGAGRAAGTTFFPPATSTRFPETSVRKIESRLLGSLSSTSPRSSGPAGPRWLRAKARASPMTATAEPSGSSAIPKSTVPSPESAASTTVLPMTTRPMQAPVAMSKKPALKATEHPAEVAETVTGTREHRAPGTGGLREGVLVCWFV